MKSLTLLGLTGLAANVGGVAAHTHHSATVSKRGVDLSAYRFTGLAQYKSSEAIKADPKISAIGKRSTYTETATELVKTVAPNAEFRLVQDHYVGASGVAHVQFKQQAHGIDIDNADFTVNVGADGKVFSYGNTFFTGKLPSSAPLQKREFSSPEDALRGAVSILGLPVNTDGISVDSFQAAGTDEAYKISGAEGVVRDPEAKLVYFVKDGAAKLTWRVETDVLDNWLLSYVDAETNKEVHGVADYVADATFEVYPWGVNDPLEGERQVITDPWNTATSEFTWLGDGKKTYTTTEGNNGIAQTNPSGGTAYLNNYRPQTNNSAFEFPYSPDMSNPKDYAAASVTQIFYTANKYHDLLYLLGFTEQAGNFETNNNGQGGNGNDFVILNSQDGSGTNNANFATPPDGQSGRMRMYLWTITNPKRDCAFSADVILHEFTHGLSNRLTGGPANSNCLQSGESGGMGEGWSDIMATATRIKKTDTRTTDYVMGEWIYNNPKGIRQYPYSTNQQTNPWKYSNVASNAEVHDTGEIWATILYEVLWNLIDKYGINETDTPRLDSKGVPDDGRYLTMKLIMEGMALQPCNPDFLAARDAIIDADQTLTQGQNKCELWTGFAKRGLGSDAKKTSTRHTDGFKVPTGAC